MPNIFYKKADFTPPDTEVLNQDLILPLIDSLLKEKFGETIRNIKPLTLSTYHFVYEFKIQNREYILKVSKFPDIIENLYLENYLYTQELKALPFGVGVHSFDVSRKQYTFPFMIMDKAKGLCLRQIDIGIQNYGTMIFNLGRAVAQYHSGCSNGSRFGLIDVATLIKDGHLMGNAPSWREYIYSNLDEHLKFAYEHEVFDYLQLQKIHKCFTPKKTQFLDEINVCLLHGDLGSHNVFIDEATLQVTSLIDWEDALLGDPLYDAAMFASFFRMDEFLDDFLRGYESVIKINDPHRQAKIWLYYLRIVIAKSVLRFKLRYDTVGASKSSPKITLALQRLEQLK